MPIRRRTCTRCWTSSSVPERDPSALQLAENHNPQHDGGIKPLRIQTAADAACQSAEAAPAQQLGGLDQEAVLKLRMLFDEGCKEHVHLDCLHFSVSMAPVNHARAMKSGKKCLQSKKNNVAHKRMRSEFFSQKHPMFNKK